MTNTFGLLVRHLLFSLLLLHPLACADITDPAHDTLAASSAAQQLTSGVVDDADATNTGTIKPLFWLSILPNQRPSLAQQSLRASINSARPTSQYWQQPESHIAWRLPEPATLLLFGAGILLVFVARRVRFANRRKKSHLQTKID